MARSALLAPAAQRPPAAKCPMSPESATARTEDEFNRYVRELEPPEALEALSSRLAGVLPATAESLRELGKAAFAATSETAKVEWSAVDLFRAFDPQVLAAAVDRHYRQGERLRSPRLLRLVAIGEVLRAVLIFLPVTLTWIGIGKAAAVFSTCKPEQDTPQVGQFLTLWQMGFQDELGRRVFGCDPSAGFSLGLPLNSLAEVVRADALVLGMLIALTVFIQATLTLRAPTGGESELFADRLRSVLVQCARQLHVARPEEAATALVRDAARNLQEVATSFQDVATGFTTQTDLMIRTLEARSGETERSLAALERSFEKVAETTLRATAGLQTVVDRVAASADRLAETSLSVRDELAAATSALRDSVRSSGAQLSQLGVQLVEGMSASAAEFNHLGKQLADGMSASAAQLAEISVSVRDDLFMGTAALRESVNNSGEQLGRLNARLGDATSKLRDMDRSVAAFVRRNAETEQRNEAARVTLAGMATSLEVLSDLPRNIDEFTKTERRFLVPNPAWWTYGVMLGFQTILILVLALRGASPELATPAPIVEPPTVRPGASPELPGFVSPTPMVERPIVQPGVSPEPPTVVNPAPVDAPPIAQPITSPLLPQQTAQ